MREFTYRCECHRRTFLLCDCNSCLYSRHEGEADYIGDYIFETGQVGENLLLNRNLLLGICVEHALVVISMFFEKVAENLVTYRGWGVLRLGDMNRYDFV